MIQIEIPQNPGLLEDQPDKRDYQYSDLMAMGAVPTEPFDWEKGYDTEKVNGFKLKRESQGSSSSCVGQTFSSYGELLNYLETKQDSDFSARGFYSQIYLPQGGAYVREGAKLATDKGFHLEKDVKSYPTVELSDGRIHVNPPTEEFMRNSDDITEELKNKAKTYKSKRYFYLTYNNIDEAALAIQNHGAITIGARGTNQGWQTSDVRPPQGEEKEWGHLTLGKAAMIRNGKKTIKFHNSWGENWGDDGDGYINEDYFKAGKVFSPLVLIDQANLINNDEIMKLIKTDSSPGIYLVSNDGKKKILLIDMPTLESLKQPAVTTITDAEMAEYEDGGTLVWADRQID